MDLGLKPTEKSLPIELQPEDRSATIQHIPTSDIRRSLKASSIDGVFAAVFSNLTGGVLLSNFLVNLHSSAFEIGILAAIPTIANVIQPLGAWLGDRSDSRQRFCTAIYVPSRLLWLFLLVGIFLYNRQTIDDRDMALWTMIIVAASHILGGLGSATWLSWMAALVPRQLRGRYFGIRNTAANLTSLIVVALAGFWVANYPGGEQTGFAIALLVGIIAGIISLIFQWQMVDIDPQVRLRANQAQAKRQLDLEGTHAGSAIETIATDKHFQGFLLCLGAWNFALNLSAPFFNLYLLQDLGIDVGWVTLYNSLTSLANLALLMPIGRWSDRIGHRIPFVVMGAVMALLPLLWLGVGTDALSLWVGLPLLFMVTGGASAAIDLCINNLQIEIAHDRHQSQYFGIVAAVIGLSSAAGTVVGGALDTIDALGGLTGLFVISSILRLLSLIPLLLLQKEGERSVLQIFTELNLWQRSES